MSRRTKNVCEWHKPKNKVLTNYVDWCHWVSGQHQSGKRQTQCPTCKRWFFPSEYGKEPKE